MMFDGVRVHSRTLEHTLSSLRPTQRLTNTPPHSHDHPPDLLHTKARHPDVQCAVELLRGAYEHRWQRTHAMYDTVIGVCLLQAEVLVASLLLALLLQDYQLHASRMQVSTEGALEHSGVLRVQPAASPGQKCHALSSWSQHLTLSIVRAIRQNIERGTTDSLFQESSEALSILAFTIDTHSLPPRRIAPLLSLLSSYPQCATRVWNRRNTGQNHCRGHARDYFHSVLDCLIKFLPTKHPVGLPLEPWRRAYFGGDKLGMDLPAYNTLLDHSLIQRRSPAMAQRIIDHMLRGRLPIVVPNCRTYAIALRGCTLMRRNDLAEQIVQAMGGDPEAAINTPVPVSLNAGPPLSRQSRNLVHSIETEHFAMPYAPTSLKLNPYLLVAYVLHLVKTGRAYQVHPLVYHYIPELDLSHQNSDDWQELPEDRRVTRLQANRKAQVERAVALGPVVLGVFIHALRLEGNTGFAERIWELMKVAEVASWQTAESWTIPVHVYTSMLLLYADEARRIRHTSVQEGVSPSHRRTDYARGFGRIPKLSEEAQQSIAAADGRRGVVGREMGLEVYRHLFLAHERLAQVFGEEAESKYIIAQKSNADIATGDCVQLSKGTRGEKERNFVGGSGSQGLGSEHRPVEADSKYALGRAPLTRQQLTPPEPDARFFDAALRLVAHDDIMDRRRTRANRSHWVQQLQCTWCRSRRPSAMESWGTAEAVKNDPRAIYHDHSIPQDRRQVQEIHSRPSSSSFSRQPSSFGLLKIKTRGLPIKRGWQAYHKRGDLSSCIR
jgi:hypothetical protein